MEHQGEGVLFEKIEKAVPKNHLDPIVLKDHNREPLPIE